MSVPADRPELHVFVREPTAGPVKTRLAATLGRSRATRLYEAFLQDLASSIAIPGVRTVVRVEPEAGLPVARGRFPLFEAIGQGEGDLGDRIVRAFEESFARGAPCAAVLGSDSPLETKERLSELFDAMEGETGAGAAIRPALDGGFVMAGFRREVFRPALLDGIAWSSGTVSSRLLANANAASIRVALLGEGEDVDLAEDVDRLAARLLLDPALAPATARLLAAHPGELGGER